jgi:hypothetical protein
MVVSDGERKLAGNAAILRYFAHSSQKREGMRHPTIVSEPRERLLLGKTSTFGSKNS